MSDQLAGTLALTRLGAIVVGVESHRVSAFFEPGERVADCDLAAILALPVPEAGPTRLLEIEHERGRFVMAVHGRVRMIAAGERTPRCHRPRLVDGVFRRACLRGVVRHESEIVYLLDVEEVASRIGRDEPREGWGKQ